MAAYVCFVINVDGTSYSNIISGPIDDSLSLLKPVQGSLHQDVFDSLGPDTFREAVLLAAANSTEILHWDDADDAARREIERRCHTALNKEMGGDVHISVSHNDQVDHNTVYHIHRIRDRVDNESPTISNEEVKERAKSWQDHVTKSWQTCRPSHDGPQDEQMRLV